MSEFIGFAYFTEIPAVLFDVQRVGPSTGLPTRTQQGDILQCAYASHGDTRHVLLFPCDPRECFELSERLRRPATADGSLTLAIRVTRRQEIIEGIHARPCIPNSSARGHVPRARDIPIRSQRVSVSPHADWNATTHPHSRQAIRVISRLRGVIPVVMLSTR